MTAAVVETCRKASRHAEEVVKAEMHRMKSQADRRQISGAESGSVGQKRQAGNCAMQKVPALEAMSLQGHVEGAHARPMRVEILRAYRDRPSIRLTGNLLVLATCPSAEGGGSELEAVQEW